MLVLVRSLSQVVSLRSGVCRSERKQVNFSIVALCQDGTITRMQKRIRHLAFTYKLLSPFEIVCRLFFKSHRHSFFFCVTARTSARV